MLTINKKYNVRKIFCTYREGLINSMLKTTFKVIMLFVLLVLVAVATGLATYTVTRNIIEEQNAYAHQTSATHQITDTDNDNGKRDIQGKEEQEENNEHYLVRLEGDSLEIHVVHSGKEEFLYNRKIYINDLSERDLEMLNSGVRLESASELTAFIENFTS